jgi:flagellar biosynthesis chaperone FliJ
MLKNLKSLFIVEEEGPTKKPAAAEKGKPVSEAKKSPAPAPTPANRSAPARPGRISEQFTGVLLKAMERANLEGFDYLEFKNALNNLKKVEADEGKRYRSAYALAQTMGTTPEQLIDTAEHYVAALAAEEKAFEEALAGQMQSQVGNRIAQVEAVEKAIQEKEARIRQLQKEVEQHRKDISATQAEVDSAKAKMETTKRDFVASYDNLVRQIQGDVENIKKHLTGEGS